MFIHSKMAHAVSSSKRKGERERGRERERESQEGESDITLHVSLCSLYARQVRMTLTVTEHFDLHLFPFDIQDLNLLLSN